MLLMPADFYYLFFWIGTLMTQMLLMDTDFIKLSA